MAPDPTTPGTSGQAVRVVTPPLSWCTRCNLRGTVADLIGHPCPEVVPGAVERMATRAPRAIPAHCPVCDQLGDVRVCLMSHGPEVLSAYIEGSL